MIEVLLITSIICLALLPVIGVLLVFFDTLDLEDLYVGFHAGGGPILLMMGCLTFILLIHTGVIFNG